MTKCTVMAFINTFLEQFTMENGKMDYSMDLACINFQMEQNTKGIERNNRYMEEEFILIRKEIIGKVYMLKEHLTQLFKTDCRQSTKKLRKLRF